MTKVWNIKEPGVPATALYIGRAGKGKGGKWGNPFELNKRLTAEDMRKIRSRLSETFDVSTIGIGDVITRELSIELHAHYLQWATINKHLDISELVQPDGNGGFEPRDMVCFCKPAACHGDYLRHTAQQFIDEISGKRAPGCPQPCEFACLGEECGCSDLQYAPNNHAYEESF